MAKLFHDLCFNYEAMISASDEQIILFDNPEFDTIISQFQQLEKLKQQHIETINEINQNTNNLVLTDEEKSKLIDLVARLRHQNSILENNINNSYSSASKEMRQTKTHLHTLKTYGGVNHSDVISYYFDAKK